MLVTCAWGIFSPGMDAYYNLTWSVAELSFRKIGYIWCVRKHKLNALLHTFHVLKKEENSNMPIALLGYIFIVHTFMNFCSERCAYKWRKTSELHHTSHKILKCLAGQVVSAPNFWSKGHRSWIPQEVEFSTLYMTLHCTEPFIITSHHFNMTWITLKGT